MIDASVKGDETLGKNGCSMTTHSNLSLWISQLGIVGEQGLKVLVDFLKILIGSIWSPFYFFLRLMQIRILLLKLSLELGLIVTLLRKPKGNQEEFGAFGAKFVRR